MTFQEILDAALQLTEKERLFIAGRILESLPDATAANELDEDDYLAELEKRSRDADGAISWAELRASLKDD